MSTPDGTSSVPIWQMEAANQQGAGEDDVSSPNSSQLVGTGEKSPEKKKRVGFTGAEVPGERSQHVDLSSPPLDVAVQEDVAVDSMDEVEAASPSHSRTSSAESPLPRNISKSHLPELTAQQTREIHQAFGRGRRITKPKPAIRRTQSNPAQATAEDVGADELPFDDSERAHREERMHQAFEEAKRLEYDQRSDPPSRDVSPKRQLARITKLDSQHGDGPSEWRETENDGSEAEPEEMLTMRQSRGRSDREAERLIRMHTRAQQSSSRPGFVTAPPSGAVTPVEEQDYINDYQPRPDHYRNGLLSTIMALYSGGEGLNPHSRSGSFNRLLPRLPRSRQSSATATPRASPPESGASSPRARPWTSPFGNKRTRSAPSFTDMLNKSRRAKPGSQDRQQPASGMGLRSSSITALNKFNPAAAMQRRREEEFKIKDHLSETLERHKYLMRLCQALMQYGAPTHRLEEYMRMSARVLEIKAQFLYIPGSMIMSLDDEATHTAEVKLIRVTQGLDLGKLRDVHDIYKDVVHDRVHVEVAERQLKEVMSRQSAHSRWFRIPVYGLAAASVGPFAFQARLIDLPIIFFLGCILGVLQLVIAPRSDLYANVFEVSAAVITSFLSRAFGSIWSGDVRLFCFSALAQSSIALILPGYIVLTASLELQARSIVAGSTRMVYAIIYSLLLGFGITIGTAIYGLIDDAASSETTCRDPLPAKWYFLFVPVFTICLIIINQAKWKQAPAMLVIALVGYVVNFYSAQRFVGNTQVSNTLGALAIGVLANLHSRIASAVENWVIDRWENDLRPHWRRLRKRFQRSVQDEQADEKKLEEGYAEKESVYEKRVRKIGYGLAVAAMLPAIFVQVPSGISVNGSLVAGIASANQIANNATNGTTVLNTTSISAVTSGTQTNTIAFTVSYSVIQVAIGITVGLFLSAIIVYPLGKRRSGLFSL